MHLQQTKAESRGSGGPQYYFHSLTRPVKEYLRAHGACPVVLQTPYGIAASPFLALDGAHKLDQDGNVVAGRVGHDRIQQAGGAQSIGEAIREWYALGRGRDFERIDVDVNIHPDGHFILVPTGVKMRSRRRTKTLEKVYAPLSFHRDYQSNLWKSQIDRVRRQSPREAALAVSQMGRVVADHCAGRTRSIHEADLLRAAGALEILGLHLSPYLTRGYDCLESCFRFGAFPVYPCPVEIKKRSSGFKYQVTQYRKLPRAVVLCMDHNLVNPPDHIDVVELPALAGYLGAV